MSSRVPLIAGNWKMHGTPTEAAALADALATSVGGAADRDVLVAPPFPALAAVVERLRGTQIAVAGQNLHWEDSGAFTGEVSAPMLVDIGCTRVLVGHSERRQFFGDSDDWVSLKVKAALRHGLVPILCVGETLPQREANETLSVVETQIRAGFADLASDDIQRLIVAYEPVWAIGTGRVASPAQAEEVHAAIRRLVEEIAGDAVAAQLRIIYGGSVKPDNIDALMREADIDGALVGGASLKADDFKRIVRYSA